MGHEWYFIREGEPQGPLPVSGIAALASQGVVGPDTFVWAQGQADWEPLNRCSELAEALEALEAQEQEASKRQRRDSGGGPPTSPRLAEEVPDWVEQLDDGSTVVLFERALFRHLEAIIRGRPTLRDELLKTYLSRHPETAGRDPACYKLTDAVLLEGVEDFESREQLWEVLGRDNLAAVRGVITAAARLDRRYCGQVHALALLSRARRLVQEGQGEQLAELLREEDSLALVRDLEGRSLWHDLVVAGGGQDWGVAGGGLGEELLLRLLLPIAAAAAAAEAAGAPGGDAAAAPGGEEGQEEQGEQEAKQQQGGQQEPHFLDLADAGGNTPLHLAAEAAQLEAARLLIDAGASLNLQNRDASKYAAGDWSLKSKDLDFAIPVPSLHQTPLHIAAEAGDLQMLGLLVERGAALDVRDVAGSTPLHLALEAQDECALELLLKAGANPALANNDMGEGSTPLHAAASMGSPGMLRLLLASGKLAGAVSVPGEQGWTPLHLAARRGKSDCVALLLEHGAARGAVNAQGKTALDIAKVNKRAAVAALLEAQEKVAA